MEEIVSEEHFNVTVYKNFIVFTFLFNLNFSKNLGTIIHDFHFKLGGNHEYTLLKYLPFYIATILTGVYHLRNNKRNKENIYFPP